MPACPVQPLIDAGKDFSKLSNRESIIAVLELLSQILKAANPLANCDPNVLLDSGKSFGALSEKDSWTVGLELLCEILNAGGSAATCIIGGAAWPPVIAGPCAFSIYYSTPGPNPGFALWDATNGLWDIIIDKGP